MERNKSIDSAAGLMILYMVFTHVCQHYDFNHSKVYVILEHIFFFFMPWFFFKAGMFFRPGDNKEFMLKSAERLLKPFVIYSVIGHLIYCLIAYFNNDMHLSTYIPVRSLLLMGSIPGNLPLWFLLTLFLCRILLNTLVNLRVSEIVIAISALSIAMILQLANFDEPYYFANCMTGLFFMCMGYMMTKKMSFTPPIWVLCIIVYTVSFFFPSFVGMRSNHLYYGSYILWIFYSLSGIVILNQICNNKYIGRLHLNVIGKYSMEIYCIHWILLMLI